MNSKNVGLVLLKYFPQVPRLSEIPLPERQWHGRKEIRWQVADDLVIDTYRHTMGRIFARARSPKFPGESVQVYATKHQSAVRALVAYCHEFYKEG